MSPILSYAICLVKSHTVHSFDQNICEVPQIAISTPGGDPRGAKTLLLHRISPPQCHPHGINEWNNDPGPFIWTKTAEEIPEILAAYRGLITDAGL